MKGYDFFALCVCGHLQNSHDDKGCMVCAAQGQQCLGFWTQAEHDAAVQSALVRIAEAEAELRDALKTEET